MSTAVATVVAVGISVLAVTMLRHVGSGSEREVAAEAEASLTSERLAAAERSLESMS